MKLLLDEMISPAIARRLRERGFDVEAVRRDRPDLEALPDAEIVRRLALERRGIVTNDVADFEPIHRRVLARDEEHYGMLFTDDATLPRSRAAVADWVRALEAFLIEHPSDDALRNRVRGLDNEAAPHPYRLPGTGHRSPRSRVDYR